MGLDLIDYNQSMTATNTTKTAAAEIVNAVNANKGVVDLSNGVIYNVFTIPSSLSYSVSSNNATGAASTTVYGFNNNVMNAAVTTNGSGAVSIVNTYGDGFSGKVYEQLSRTCNAGQGIKILGFTIQATNYTSGAQVSSVFATLGLTLIASNGMGASIPVTIDLSEALRNTQYQVGILTVNKGFYLNAMTQLQMLLPANTTLTFTFFTEASGFRG